MNDEDDHATVSHSFSLERGTPTIQRLAASSDSIDAVFPPFSLLCRQIFFPPFLASSLSPNPPQIAARWSA